MTATRAARVLIAAIAGAVFQTASAGSTLNVLVTVAYGSGPCGAAVTHEAVSVFCGPIPVLATVGAGGGLSGQTMVAGTFMSPAPPYLGFGGGETVGAPTPFNPALTSPAPDETSWGPAVPDVQAEFRQVGVLPPSVTGHSALAIYSGRANVSGWRVVSIDNAEHVELTISW